MSRRLCALLLLVLLGSAVMALLRPGADAASQSRAEILAPASAAHLAGTDDLGRDRLTRTAAALLLGVSGAVLASAVTTLIAAAAGSAAAFSPLPVQQAVLLVTDVVLALPWLFLLMLVRAGLPLHTRPAEAALITFALLAALGWPACARAVYRGVVQMRGGDAMLYARCAGLRCWQIARTQVLPGLRPLLVPQFVAGIPSFVVAEANLGTLGLGIPEPLPSFGTLLAEMGDAALLTRTAWVFLPLGVLCATLLLLETLTRDREAVRGLAPSQEPS